MSEAGKVRMVIVFDGKAWHVRRLRAIEHNLERDEKVYHCDAPISSDHATLADVPEVAALLAAAPEPPDQAQVIKKLREALQEFLESMP